MTSFNNKIHKTIGYKLLKYVFGLYFCVAFLLTAFHIYISFENAEQNVLFEMKRFETTFGKGLSEAIWVLDYSQLKALIEGIDSSSIVIGVKVEDKLGTEIQTWKGDQLDVGSELVKYTFPLNIAPTGTLIKVGYCTIYSSRSIIFEQVKVSIYVTLINAILKTLALWIIFLWVSRKYLSKPLERLIDETERISSGDYSEIRIEQHIDQDNELSQLILSYNNMSKNLSLAHEELFEANQELQKNYDNVEIIQNRLKSIIDVLPSAIIAIDDNNLVIDWNQAATNLFEMEIHNIIGKPIQLVGNSISFFFEEVENARNKDTTVKMHRLRDDRYFDNKYFDLICFPLKSNLFTGVIIRLDDITQQVMIDDKQMQSEKMNSLLRLGDDIISKLAPRVMQALEFSDQLYKDINTESFQVKRNLVSNNINKEQFETFIDIKTKRKNYSEFTECVELIKDDFRFFEDFSGAGRKEKSPINFSLLLNNIKNNMDGLSFFKENQKYNDIIFHVKCKSEYIMFMCYEHDIEKAIIELIKNSVIAVKLVDHPVIALRLKEVDNNIELIITDNGCGMNEQICSRALEPFFTTRNDKSKTNGLGLSIVYSIVEAHNGSMQIESEEGEGTTVRITFTKEIF